MAAIVHPDRLRGHIAIQPEDGKPVSVTFTDMGDGTLHMWAYSPLDLHPSSVRELASALNDWADLRTVIRPPEEVPS